MLEIEIRTRYKAINKLFAQAYKNFAVTIKLII